MNLIRPLRIDYWKEDFGQEDQDQAQEEYSDCHQLEADYKAAEEHIWWLQAELEAANHQVDDLHIIAVERKMRIDTMQEAGSALEKEVALLKE